jgi:tetratricopeptide (TPR) repeat protein
MSARVRHASITFALVGALIAAGACRARPRAPSGPPGPPLSGASLPRLQATSGALALRNLDAEIDSLGQQARRAPLERAARASLVELLLSRGQFIGSIGDYQRAAAIAEALVIEAPRDAGGYLARAGTHATFHRFDAALADLARAEQLGLPADKTVAARAAILAATGRFDAALALRPLRPADEARLGTMELASAGLLRGEMGDARAAERLLARARESYRDVSPFPLAWMDAQQASLLERHGDLAGAKAHYARAVALLPLYARAAAHLAALSSPAEAQALLEPVAARSDDPEVLVQLADALRRNGHPDQAARRLAAGIGRYDELVQLYPAAFADHAAALWLGAGRDPARALPLARLNLTIRQTPEAYELALSAALAAHDSSDICPVARQALALKYTTPSLRALAAPIVGSCS